MTVFVRNVHDSYTARIGDTNTDHMCPVTWRRNGRDQGWSNTRLVPLIGQEKEICEEIIAADVDPPKHATLFILEKSRPFYHGPVSINELDVLAAKSPASFENDRFTATADVIGHRLLLRLSIDGMLEVIPFVKNPKAEMAYPQQRSAFFIYHAATDAVCGSEEYGTRITDCAKSYPLPELLSSLNEANLVAMAKTIADFFFSVINPAYAIPYQTLESKIRKARLANALLGADTHQLITSILQCHPEIAHPAKITISLPSTPQSRARVQRHSLRTEGITRSEIAGMIEFLVGVAIYDISASKPSLTKNDDLQVATDISRNEPATITIETDGDPSYHDQIETRRKVVALWNKTLERKDIAMLTLIAAHGTMPLNVRSALTEFLSE